MGIKIGGLDFINPTIRADGLKCDDLATKIGGPDSNDLTIKIGEPPNFDGGVRVRRWRTCAKLAKQMVQLLKGTCLHLMKKKRRINENVYRTLRSVTIFSKLC